MARNIWVPAKLVWLESIKAFKALPCATLVQKENNLTWVRLFARIAQVEPIAAMMGLLAVIVMMAITRVKKAKQAATFAAGPVIQVSASLLPAIPSTTGGVLFVKTQIQIC